MVNGSADPHPAAGKRVAAIQSCYLPWKGFFDIIHDADLFIFLDDVQYTERNWRNRNKIKLPDGSTPWLTVPVHASQDQRICDIAIDYDTPWIRKHLESIRHAYSKAPHFDLYFSALESTINAKPGLLSELNQSLIRTIAGWLGITTEIEDAARYAAQGKRQDRMIDLVLRAGGTTYLSGPVAKDYLSHDDFAAQGIALEFKTYGPYREYLQSGVPFVHEVTVLDLLFHTGDKAPEYIWGRPPSEDA